MRNTRKTGLVLGVFLAVAGVGNGAQTTQLSCATCHVKEAASQPMTSMGRALLPLGQNPTLKALGKLTFRIGKFSYTVDQSAYSVTDGEHTVTLPIEWTFGAGAQTFVLSRDGSFFESMVSYYPETKGLDITLGDEGLNPQSIDEAIGHRLGLSTVTACFNCHSTHAVKDHKLDLAGLSPGLQCERCHSDAPAHLNAMMHGDDAKAPLPEKLGARPAESISNFCGQCHRSWETVVRNNWRGEINVRFQPYRLANSRCFDGTDPRISCVACHNPHQDLVRDAKQYDGKCLACHATATAKACPVSKSNCVTCHMPKVQLPGGHQTFTDHDIRVVRAGDVYPN